MSWRDGGFTIPSLEERQYTMLIRTTLDMMSTTDIQLLKIMRQFEKEEPAVYNCTIQERDPNGKNEGGGFLRWYGHIPDLRSHAPRPSGPFDQDDFYHPGETELHEVLRKDLSIFPRALKAAQELGLSIWMNDSDTKPPKFLAQQCGLAKKSFGELRCIPSIMPRDVAQAGTNFRTILQQIIF
jgi:hypothetical protein